MEVSPDAKNWAEANVRHFCRLLYAACVLFVATELTAMLGVVPHLRPVSVQDITANILFAIGFGCPFVLHVSSLPRLRELIATLLAGSVMAIGIWQVHQWIGVPEEYKPEEVIVAEVVTGLGLASLVAMSVRAWCNVGFERTAALAFLLPASVSLVITLEAGIFLYYIKGVCPESCDPSAYACDAAFGEHWSVVVGRPPASPEQCVSASTPSQELTSSVSRTYVS